VADLRLACRGEQRQAPHTSQRRSKPVRDNLGMHKRCIVEE
jgi:hypothetical protein